MIADGAIDWISPGLSVRTLDVLSLSVPAQLTGRVALHLAGEPDLRVPGHGDSGVRGQRLGEGGAGEHAQLQLARLPPPSRVTSRAGDLASDHVNNFKLQQPVSYINIMFQKSLYVFDNWFQL